MSGRIGEDQHWSCSLERGREGERGKQGGCFRLFLEKILSHSLAMSWLSLKKWTSHSRWPVGHITLFSQMKLYLAHCFSVRLATLCHCDETDFCGNVLLFLGRLDVFLYFLEIQYVTFKELFHSIFCITFMSAFLKSLCAL